MIVKYLEASINNDCKDKLYSHKMKVIHETEQNIFYFLFDDCISLILGLQV